MENLQKNNNVSKEPIAHRIMDSVSLKMFITGFITLVLLIPLNYVDNLIYERKNRKKEVINKIDKEWGNDVLIYGPVMEIPYKTYKETIYFDAKGKKVTKTEFDSFQSVYVYPDFLDIKADIESLPKKIGIYKSVVYRSDADLQGDFSIPDLQKLDIAPKDVDWKNTKILFFTTNNKGIQEKIYFKTEQQKSVFTLEPNSFPQLNKYKEFVAMPFTAKPAKTQTKLDFKINYQVKGSQEFHVMPVANRTSMQIVSNWKDIKFDGAFLPENNDKILPNGQGIDAKWQVIDYQRPFKKIYLNILPSFKNYDFGLHFLVPVDEYVKSTRATKYAYLVIFLTFLVFLIIEKTGHVKMHAFQYFLIGLALVIFYTLLISFSEHIRFNFSYFIASTATVLLIGLYSKAILNSPKFMWLIFSSLSALYLYIFVIIQLENYALLVGSVGLFMILAVIMYFSRRIKWS